MTEQLATPLAVRLEAQFTKFEKALSRVEERTGAAMRGVTNHAQRMERESAAAAERMASKVQKSLNRAFSLQGIGGAAGALAALSAALGVREVVAYTDQWKQAQGALSAAGVAVENMAAKQQQLFEIAQRARVDMQSIVRLYARLGIVSQDLAADHEKLAQVVETTAKAMQIGGSTTQEAQAAIIQFTQAVGSGRLAGDELRSITENAPILSRAIADYIGVSIGQLKKLGEEGKLTSDKVIAAVLQATGSIEVAYQNMPLRVNQALQQLNNAFGRYIGASDESLGASARLSAGISALAANFDTVAAAVGVIAALLAGRLANSAYAAAAGYVAKRQAAQSAAQADAIAARTAFQAAVADQAAARAAVLNAEANLAAASGTKTKTAAAQALMRAQQAQTIATNAASAAMTRFTAAAHAAHAATTLAASAGRALRGAFAFIGGWPGLILAAAAAFYAMRSSAQSTDDKIQDLESSLNELESATRDIENIDRDLVAAKQSLIRASESYQAALRGEADAAQSAALKEIAAVNRRIAALEALRQVKLQLAQASRLEAQINLQTLMQPYEEAARRRIIRQQASEGGATDYSDNLEYAGVYRDEDLDRRAAGISAEQVRAAVEADVRAIQTRIAAMDPTVTDAEFKLAQAQTAAEQAAAMLELLELQLEEVSAAGVQSDATDAAAAELTRAQRAAFNDLTAAGAAEIQRLKDEQAELGQTAAAVATLRFERKLLAMAEAAGVSGHDEVTEAVTAQVAAFREQAEALAKARAETQAQAKAEREAEQAARRRTDAVDGARRAHEQRMAVMTAEINGLRDGPRAADHAKAAEQQAQRLAAAGVPLGDARVMAGNFAVSQARLADQLAGGREQADLAQTSRDRLAELQAEQAALAGGAAAADVYMEAWRRLADLRDLDAGAAEARLSQTREEVAQERALADAIAQTRQNLQALRQLEQGLNKRQRDSAFDLSVAGLDDGAIARARAVYEAVEGLRDDKGRLPDGFDRAAFEARVAPRLNAAIGAEEQAKAATAVRDANQAYADQVAVLEAYRAALGQGVKAAELARDVEQRARQERGAGISVDDARRAAIEAEIVATRDLAAANERAAATLAALRQLEQGLNKRQRDSAFDLSVAGLDDGAIARARAVYEAVEGLRDDKGRLPDGFDRAAFEARVAPRLNAAIGAEEQAKAATAVRDANQAYADQVAVLEAYRAALGQGVKAAELARDVEQRARQERGAGISVDDARRAAIEAEIVATRDLAAANERAAATLAALRQLEQGLNKRQRDSAFDLSVAGLDDGAIARARAVYEAVEGLRDDKGRLPDGFDRAAFEARVAPRLNAAIGAEEQAKAATAVRDANQAYADQVAVLEAYRAALGQGVKAAELARDVEQRARQERAAGISVDDARRAAIEAEIVATRDANAAIETATEVYAEHHAAAARLADVDQTLEAARGDLISLTGSAEQAERILAKARVEAAKEIVPAYQQAADALKALEGPQSQLTDLLKNEQAIRAALIETLIAQGVAEDVAAQQAEQAFVQRLAAVRGQLSTLQKYINDLKNPAKEFEDAMTSALKASEDAFVAFVTTGKLNFSDMVDAMIADLARLVIRQTIMAPLAGALVSGVGAAAGALFGGPGVVQVADGGYIAGPGGPRDDVIPAMLSNGEFVINAAATRRNRSLLEKINAGAETAAFADGGAVPARAAGFKATVRRASEVTQIQVRPQVTVNVIGAPTEPRVETQDDGNGGLTMNILFDAVDDNLAGRLARGRGSTAAALRDNYGLQKKLRG